MTMMQMILGFISGMIFLGGIVLLAWSCSYEASK